VLGERHTRVTAPSPLAVKRLAARPNARCARTSPRAVRAWHAASAVFRIPCRAGSRG